MRSLVRLVAVPALLLAGAACDDGDSGGTGSTTTSAAATSTTTAASSTSSATTATTLAPYGSACAKGSHPDCIDPDGDGKYELLKNGAQCMQRLGDSGLCSDLDGDGVAGYPDRG
jgi:hypothetical protein